MKIQSIFSIKRFGLLIKRETIMKQSFLLMAIAGVIITITTAIVLFLMTDRSIRLNWDDFIFPVSIIMFAIFGILFSGTAFPALRNHKKTLDFLLVPNSTTEKYLYEVLFRIVAYSLVFPVLFWIGANLGGIIINSFTLDHYDLGYNLFYPFKEIHKYMRITETEVAIYSFALFLISIPFTGAAFFSKVPLLKTAIFLAILVGASFFYGWILDGIFNFTHTRYLGNDVSEKAAMNWVTAALLFSTLVLHTSAFFRLKEREV
jgi:hypothetical protein